MTEEKQEVSRGVEHLPQDELEAQPTTGTAVPIDPEDADVANKVPESALQNASPQGDRNQSD